ncbi:bacillithiol system protein YtxJ [Chryseobacterium piscicola]|jgi:bacillithiol system protein YtxJ|uniref:Bacillithiol system protein YtxJ n=1 Tax=Chryseobacterium piscicola TaxID=551459 RepID=A0A1N7LHB0_9FLAO|nr:bacillithiol system redox-active protein YtxJ [Chryseobacterium piscicola]PQA97627.1 thioredoxin family protein [Chryseobacterium piscicola]SIS73225.1 bacillithiol system protein YtxJ [Chryseobacterium piscicola]
MSLFGKIFGDNKEEENKNSSFWKVIENEDDLKNAVKISETKIIAIFKHSTKCFISKTVLKNFENEVKNTQNLNVDFYFLDLIKYREISNKIAEDFDVRHESPQLIVFENGRPLNNASHQDISLSQIIK